MVARVLAVAALAAIALAGAASAQYTFCEYYTGALNPTVATASTNATLQAALVNAVVVRAAVGNSGSPVGLVNDPLNQGYFNGTLTPFINYLAPANNASLTDLVGRLDRFFGAALGCRAYSALFPWTPSRTMRVQHAAMNINNAIETSFVNQVAGSLASYGVTLGEASSRTSELAYALALFSQFNRYASAAADTNNYQICSQADCPLARQIYQFHLNADGSITPLAAGGSNTITVNSGDYINFRFASTNGLTRTSSATNTTAIAVSGGVNAVTYTVQVSTAASTGGVYYWYNNAGVGTATTAGASSRVQVTVTPSDFDGSSTGTSTGTTTGSAATGTGNGAGATASLGFAAVAAVVAAAFVVA